MNVNWYQQCRLVSFGFCMILFSSAVQVKERE